MWGWALALALLTGTVTGALTRSAVGFWLAVPAGFGVGLLVGLARRTARLERRLEELAAEVAALQAGAAPPETTSKAAPSPPPGSEPPPAPVRSPSPPQPDLWRAAEPRPWSVHPVVTGLLRRLAAFFTGDDAVVRIGLLVLFFGVAFLYRYGLEHHWIRAEWNLILVALAALAALVWGWRLRRRRPSSPPWRFRSPSAAAGPRWPGCWRGRPRAAGARRAGLLVR